MPHCSVTTHDIKLLLGNELSHILRPLTSHVTVVAPISDDIDTSPSTPTHLLPLNVSDQTLRD